MPDTLPATLYRWQISAAHRCTLTPAAAGTLSSTPGADGHSIAIDVMNEFADARSLQPWELDGLIAAVWPDTDPADRYEVAGSEWRP
jgi:hypothetical protein